MASGDDPTERRPGVPSIAPDASSPAVRPHLGIWSIVRDSFRRWGVEWRDLYLAAVLVLGALAARQVLTQVVAQLAERISHADEVHVIAHGLVALVVSPFTVLPAILMTFELLDQRGELEPE